MTPDALHARLTALAEPGYRDFMAKLLPTVDRDHILGVRAPFLRNLAGELKKTGAADDFMGRLPHAVHEENLVHAYLLGLETDAVKALAQVDAFLLHVHNWAVCDAIKPLAFSRHHSAVAPRVRTWLDSPLPYAQRYGFVALLCHFLGEHFQEEHLLWAANHPAGDYYVDMARAWYLSMALVDHWEAGLPLIARRQLDPWTHRKAIQKAVESRQISPARKAILKSYR